MRLTSIRQIMRAILIALIFASAGSLILIYQFVPTEVVKLELGDVVPKDIVAPRQVVYTSTIETEAARDRARSLVSTVYSPPDPKVARQQVERLRKIFDFLDSVRADAYGSLAEKSEWIAAIPDVNLSDLVVDQILIMNDTDWAETRQEALAVLDEAMRAEIRENQVASTRRQLPTKVALDTPDNQSSVIVALTEDLILPNTFPDEARTEAERQAAANSIPPVQATIEQNELVIFSLGDVANALKIKAADTVSGLAGGKTPFAGLEVPARTYGAPVEEDEAADPEPAPEPAPEPVVQKKSRKPAARTASPEQAPANGLVDPMQWWGALTQQFQGIAANAMKDMAKQGALDATRNVASGLTEQAVKTATGMAGKAAGSVARNVGTAVGMGQAAARAVGDAARGTASRKPAARAATAKKAPAKKKAVQKAAPAPRASAPVQTLSPGDWTLPTAFFPGLQAAAAPTPAAKKKAPARAAPRRR